MGPSVGLLCRPLLTATNFSYRFPIFETSATALCGTCWYEYAYVMDDRGFINLFALLVQDGSNACARHWPKLEMKWNQPIRKSRVISVHFDSGMSTQPTQCSCHFMSGCLLMLPDASGLDPLRWGWPSAVTLLQFGTSWDILRRKATLSNRRSPALTPGSGRLVWCPTAINSAESSCLWEDGSVHCAQ